MLLFRSEEHVNHWLEDRSLSLGALLTPEQMWRLAKIWYEDRLDPAWRRKTAEEAQAIFAEIGLTGDFWRLQPQ